MARIAFLTERLLQGWGVDHVVHRVADGLGRAGHAVEVICLRADSSHEYHAYTVRLLEVPRELDAAGLEDAVAARGRVLVQRPCDLYVACMYPFHAVASRLGLPFVYWEFGVVDPVGVPRELRRLLERLRRTNRRHQRAARRVVAISRFLAETQVDVRCRDRTDVVHLGADGYGPPPDERAVRALRARLGLEDAEVVGYVGRIERATYKGVDDLLEIGRAVRARRPRARLLLVGHLDAAARGSFADLPGVVVYPDPPSSEMPLLLQAMDVGVSATRWEGFNLPLAELQHAGRPVVAYRVGAHPEVVGPGSRLVEAQGDFVDAVCSLLEDPEARRRGGNDAQAFASRFTWAATTAGMAESLRRAAPRADWR